MSFTMNSELTSFAMRHFLANENFCAFALKLSENIKCQNAWPIHLHELNCSVHYLWKSLL